MNSPSQFSIVCRAVLAASVILAASAVLAWSTPEYLDPTWGRRLAGALLGAVVVAYANAIPKTLMKRLECVSPAAEQRVRRVAGWALVLGGLGYMLAWLLAPLHLAGMIGGLTLGTAVTCAALACLRIRACGARH